MSRPRCTQLAASAIRRRLMAAPMKYQPRKVATIAAVRMGPRLSPTLRHLPSCPEDQRSPLADAKYNGAKPGRCRQPWESWTVISPAVRLGIAPPFENANELGAPVAEATVRVRAGERS